MFRGMRRFKQQLPEADAIKVLENADSGVLAVLGDEDYPYTVPMSYIYADGKIYFHSGATGHKNDAIKKHDKASFCVVSKDDVVPEKFTTNYRSVVAFGRIRFVEDKEEVRRLTTMLTMKYCADFAEDIPKRIEAVINNLSVIEMEIEHITGKESMDLVNQRNSK